MSAEETLDAIVYEWMHYNHAAALKALHDFVESEYKDLSDEVARLRLEVKAAKWVDA